MNKNHRNIEGYSDRTAGAAVEKFNHEQAEVSRLVKLIREVADLSGYDILGRIVLENKESGAIYR